MVKPPRSVWPMWAGVFLSLGAALCGFGLLAQFAAIPVRSGNAADFLRMGGLCLIVGGACALWSRRNNAIQRRLRRDGTAVSGTVHSVKHHIYVNWNRASFSNAAGHNSPWSVCCEYSYGGRTYTVRSDFLWARPAGGGQCPTIYLDPRRPGRAFIDPDTIRTVP